jgi:hypothetical protein
LARVVLGFYPGYLIGFFEVLEYVFMTTASVTYCGEMFLAFIGCDPKYTPAMWFIFYGFAGLFTLTDARTFWISSNLVAIVSLLMIAIYVFGSLKYANLAQNGPYYNNTGSWYNATAVQANLSDPTLMIWNQRNYSGTGQNFTQVFLTPSYTPQQLKDPSVRQGSVHCLSTSTAHYRFCIHHPRASFGSSGAWPRGLAPCTRARPASRASRPCRCSRPWSRCVRGASSCTDDCTSALLSHTASLVPTFSCSNRRKRFPSRAWPACSSSSRAAWP